MSSQVMLDNLNDMNVSNEDASRNNKQRESTIVPVSIGCGNPSGVAGIESCQCLFWRSPR